MSYAMALDNSWNILTEEEMYDVNGGFYTTRTHEDRVGGVIALAIIAGSGLFLNKVLKIMGIALWMVPEMVFTKIKGAILYGLGTYSSVIGASCGWGAVKAAELAVKGKNYSVKSFKVWGFVVGVSVS